jgi:hypothetical protein
LRKVARVAGGYCIAFAVAIVAVLLRMATYTQPDAYLSSGMYAFSESLLFMAVFGTVGLVPTGFALYYLRPYRRFWVVIAGLGIFSALGAATAGVLFAVGRSAHYSTWLGTLSSLSVLRIFPAPFFGAGFLVAGVFSPYPGPRWVLLATGAVEFAVFVYATIVWFIPLVFNR